MNTTETLKLATRAAATLAATGLSLAVWGLAIEPRRLDRRAETGLIPGLPTAWEGQRVALLADLQVGIWLSNADTVRRAIRRLLQERPALVLIAGDFVYQAVRNPARAAEQAVELVRPLPEAGLPTYGVLGNHDYATESAGPPANQHHVAERLQQALEAAGVRVLQNDALPLPWPAGSPPPDEREPPLYLVGIGPHKPPRDRPLEAIRRVPPEAPRLVLMHNPRSFAELPPGSAPLALAGHTHGGQIRVPFKPKWTLGRLILDWPEYVDGWIERYGKPGNRLYVNRGIGFSHYPVRIGCPPELTIFTLRRPPSKPQPPPHP